MRILFTVEFYEPRKGGAEEVVRQLSERLLRRGHVVTIATTAVAERLDKNIRGVMVEEFRLSGNDVKGIVGTEEEKKRYQSLLISGGFDVVINYAAQTWCTDLALPVLEQIVAKKIFIPCGYSRLYAPAYRRYFDILPKYLKQYDKLVYMSSGYQDYVFGEQYGCIDKAVIIPNGAGEEFLLEPLNFKQRYNITTPKMVITVSNHYFAKGHLFVIDAFKKMRRSDTALVIIGERPSGHSWYSCYPICKLNTFLHSRIKTIESVPREWVVSAYQQADLFLFGSQVECAPLVMYEAFASKTPFVTTEVGNVKDHESVLKIVKTPLEMANTANKLLNNEGEGEGLAKKAYRLWQEHHTWERIVEQYETMFLAL
ncbi:glycosyltransferase family 4 protein [Candidatus Dependentiae bacterium]|nr:glycosyltransferase family 4 protein [Candidatus Dependentiae bacterium]